VKHPGNPVLGGQYGTCFDVAVLRENEAYRMWVSAAKTERGTSLDAHAEKKA